MGPVENEDTRTDGSSRARAGSDPAAEQAVGPDPTTVAAIAAVGAVVAPFISAFMNRLGERLGDAVSFRWVWKHVKGGTVTGGKLVVTEDRAAPPLTVVIDKDLPDDARLALIELDTADPELRGKTLIWDAAQRGWRAEAPSDRRR